MEFFDKLGAMASETYKYTAEKTGKLAKEAKLKMKMNENKSKIEELYEEIGKITYQKHVREENINIKEDIGEYCNQIDKLSAEIENERMELLNLKAKKQCPNCYIEMEIEYHYCPNCGANQEENTAEEKQKEEEKESSSSDEEIEIVEVSEDEEE